MNIASLLQAASTLSPSRGRMVLRAIAAKGEEAKKETTFEAALESMAVAMEARIAKELEDQFTD